MGIVMHLSDYMTQNGVRILNLSSEMASAPFTDDPMFKLRCVLDLPPDVCWPRSILLKHTHTHTGHGGLHRGGCRGSVGGCGSGPVD